ncbi:hypothetical protein [Paeniglutamicibacter gangotriensis]|uniref:Uncharacterized protein n=1 Tax=Paeniglutamicibacter gangotriensis Lz1y TaxID=1276920 RepID=M7MPS7_9MICC|nr:hypothetical protein [Paeniglutamicibacter gangotriensis]EMQ98362.1 hypothetical protein ADIAG_02381 [Paeniglutamicibacter gangotriensis Lz1y]
MSDLEARIAEVLAPLLCGEGRLQWERKWEDSSPLVKSAWSVLAREYATMLAPVITSSNAKAWHEGFNDGKRQDAEGDDGPRFTNPYHADSLEAS